MNDSVDFGEHLKAAMRMRGMSQYELGDVIDRDASDVGKWCRGVCLPKIDTVRKLAKALNVTTDFLINGRCEADNWIPAVKPPETDERVYCTVLTEHRERVVTTACYNKDGWTCEPKFVVLAWQPMPAVYMGW